jgi:hypothetical protein
VIDTGSTEHLEAMKSASGKVRIGIIGAGGIAAKLHLPGLTKLADRCEVTLISGRRESRLHLLRERFGIPQYTQNHEDVIADDHIDAVIIATPHSQHVEWGIRAIEAGKHVLLEKPLCADMAEADNFVSAVERGNHTALCLPHFSPAIYALRRSIHEGAIGRISGVRARTSHSGPEIYYREVREIFSETDEDLWFFDSRRASVYDSHHAPVQAEEVEGDCTIGSIHGHFLDCIGRNTQPPLSHAHAARHVTEILLAGLKSAQTECAVDISSMSEGKS